ncbi:MAG: glycosyltransferase family 2 protein [Pyrinomonadaceae bacterium]
MTDILIKTALVIPVHNRRETTLQGLRSLSRIDKSGLDVRIFVVDDGSTDGTSDAIRGKFPEVEIIQGDGTLHYAAGTNRGIETALKWNPEFIVIMNDDAVFHEQFLQRLIQTAQRNPHSVVGALLLLWNEPHKVFQVGFEWRTLKGGWHVPEDLTAFSVPRARFEVENIVGNCVLLPVEAIRECGLMDEKHFPHGWGDAQYTTKMRKMGWKLLVNPRSLVWCEPNTYPQPLHQSSVSESLNTLFINEKHPANLKRQLVSRWYSAPTKFKALAAFAVYCLSLAQKVFVYGFRNR